MTDEPRHHASSGYALDRLRRALDTAAGAADPATRRRAAAKADAWRAVLHGMAEGTLAVGSRTPVADTPAWVTLEVAHGGFATGRYLAEAPLDLAERAVLRRAGDVPGTTDRERLNLWYLGDEGQAELLARLRDRRYAVDVPEQAALPVVAWLLDRGHGEAALDLVAELRPWLHRLRLTPRLRDVARPAGVAVHVASAGEVADALRAAAPPAQVAAMLETVRVWLPLYDRLVALWCDTVEGDLPHLVAGRVAGGWPCRTWPADWAERRARWLADHAAATAANHASAAHRHPRANFARLRAALEACEHGSAALSARDVGWVRRALANTVTAHGAPGTEPRAALRATQAAVAARGTYAELAHALAARLDAYPREGGVPSVEEVVGAVDEEVPAHLVAKVTRALEAPVGELVERGVIPSGEVLARVLPQVTGQVMAAGIEDEELAALYGATYAAFRRRRGLLLLDLEHQVRFDELPWVGALAPFRAARADAAASARQALDQAVLLALTAFPHAIPPNTLVREIGALAKQAGVPLPLVEEVAADIFMGTFTAKWRTAAALASEALRGTLYARYYDLPAEWAPPPRRQVLRWGKETAEDFAALCAARAEEAQPGGGHGWRSAVPRNGTVIEQAQILTTHNLAALVTRLGLEDRLRPVAPDLAARAFGWIARARSQRVEHPIVALRVVKNAAYAWRQAVFFLSLCDEEEQRAAVAAAGPALTAAGLGPAVAGLAHVVAGGSFGAAGLAPGGGRRLLGWTVGPHWAVDLPHS